MSHAIYVHLSIVETQRIAYLEIYMFHGPHAAAAGHVTLGLWSRRPQLMKLKYWSVVNMLVNSSLEGLDITVISTRTDFKPLLIKAFNDQLLVFTLN